MTELLDKLAPDFVALQADLAPVDKSAANPFFKSKYAPLPEVRKAMQPILAKHNFGLAVFPAIIVNEVTGEPQNGLRFMLLHASGQKIEGEWLLTPAKNDSQGQGADTTYKRRFGEMSITGLVADEDDDGHAASFRPAPQVAAKRPSAPPKPPSEADLKRGELRKMATENGWDLAHVAQVYAESVQGGDLKTANADEIEAFMTSVEAGVIKI